MAIIEVLAGISVPYVQNKDTKKWSGTVGHSWKIDNVFVQAFAKEADIKIRNRAKNHGKIPFPPKPKSLAQLFADYLDKNKNVSFYDFVKTVQVSNGISLKTSRVQSKVVLIFLKYKKERQDSTEENPVFIEKLLVVLLKDKSALQFGDDGEPLGTEVIDFEDVMQGAIIDIDDFEIAILKKEDIDVSFINGSGGTANYFVDFFDAEGVIKNKESVINVLKALEDFSARNKLTRTQREYCSSKVKAKIEFNERNKLTTKLQDISAVIYDSLKTVPELNIKRDTFEVFISEFDYKVNEEFNVAKNERDTLEFISFATEVGDLKLKKSLFSDKKNVGNINFNSNTNELEIRTKIKDPETIIQLNKLQNE
jgi:nucleoid-associated protein YejK